MTQRKCFPCPTQFPLVPQPGHFRCSVLIKVRFRDLRHSFAVPLIRSEDDIKIVQGNLGHATAAFTLDVYGHVAEQMKQAGTQRMEGYIKRALDP